MKTSIELSDDLLTRVREFNKAHPDRPINVSAVCRLAIEKALNKALEED
jgi:post-segregation antitoxin (ccd killing protein)